MKASILFTSAALAAAIDGHGKQQLADDGPSTLITRARPVEPTLPVPVIALNATATAQEASLITSFAYPQETATAEARPPSGPALAARGKKPKHKTWSQGEHEKTTKVKPKGGPKPTCTTRTEILPAYPDSTSTKYHTTVKEKIGVDCGGCKLEYWTSGLWFFAPITLTETITAGTSTKTDFTCEVKETGKSDD